MLQYLLNTSFIWLISLIVFDIFLRRESYHGYNRAYLLLTLLMGVFLPMLQWQQPDTLQDSAAVKPIANALVIKQGMIEAATPAQQATIDWQQWLLITYLAGVALSCILLVREIAVLMRYTKTGKHSRDGVWRIVETGKDHSPFSAFRYVFIKSKNDYAPEELRMILTHEEQHGHSLHFLDILLMELIKIIFWFHPLVYIYRQRLLIVHEYQADAAIEHTPKQYGEFLITQAILHAAPALSHSFNRSPIKKRITMLTRQSGLAAGFKRLIAIPLCITCAFLFTENAFSKDAKKEGNKLYYNGNVFELWAPGNGKGDTMMIENPVTGDMELIISRIDSFPVKMNGKEIFRVDELSRAEIETFDQTTGKEIRDYFMKRMIPAIQKMNDGNYGVSGYIILNEDGQIVYSDKFFIFSYGDRIKTEDVKTAVEKDLNKIVAATTKKFTPAKRGGQNVIIRLEGLLSSNMQFEVKDHNVTVQE